MGISHQCQAVGNLGSIYKVIVLLGFLIVRKVAVPAWLAVQPQGEK